MRSKGKPVTMELRRAWVRPQVERLIASGAEDLYGDARTDGVYSTS